MNQDFPKVFAHRPFTRQQALAAGITARQLEGPRFQRIFRGVYASAGLVLNARMRAEAALLLAPPDAVLSHLTALSIYGLDLPGQHHIHVSTQDKWVTRAEGVCGHRRIYDISRRLREGLPITGPERTIVDLAASVTLPWLVASAEYLVNQGQTTPDLLIEYAGKRHLHGVQQLRTANIWIRAGAESPMESITRLLILFAGLPEPETQVNVFDQGGNFLARADLAYRRWKLAIEYDGIWHERTASQRNRDRDRRESLQGMGWDIVTFHDTDLRNPWEVPRRVFEALQRCGFQGPAPSLSKLWLSHVARGKLWAVYDPKSQV